MSFGETGKLDPSRWQEKFSQAWSVVDFEFVGSADWSRPKYRPYRNRTERELAEHSRIFEAARLAAEAEGAEREPSEDELRYKAKSAAYNRKLSHALASGEDTAFLTVTAEEIEAELGRLRRKRRLALR